MSDAGEEWIPLAEAVRFVTECTGKPVTANRLTVCEWLRDGMVSARADRLIDHQLVQAPPDDDPATALDRAIAAGPLPIWEWPTEAVVEDLYILPDTFWSPIPLGIEEHEVWTSGRLTTAAGDGSRARRDYIGIRIQKQKIEATANLYGFGRDDRPSDPTPAPSPDRPLVRAAEGDIIAAIRSMREQRGTLPGINALTGELRSQFESVHRRRVTRESVIAALEKAGLRRAPGRRDLPEDNPT